MLHQQDFVEIGFIRKAHGHQGAAKIAIEDLFHDDLSSQNFIFMEIQGYKVPFRIENLSYTHDLIIKLARISSPEELGKYHLAKLFLLKTDLKSSLMGLDQKDFYHSLKGLTLHDQTKGLVGEIVEIEEYPQQTMAVVRVGNDDKLVPLHEDLIIGVEPDSNRLLMDLPEGLI